jgi:hypothetical protein
MIAKHSSHFPSFVVVVYNQRLLVPADHALLSCRLYISQKFICNNTAKLSATVSVSIPGTAFSAPAIQPVSLAIMQRKEL